MSKTHIFTQYNFLKLFNTQVATFFFLIIGVLPNGLFALPFNEKVSDSDKAVLDSGSILARSIDKYKNAALKSDNSAAVKMLQEIKSMSPNYLAEMIQVRAYEGNEGLLDKMEAVLLDVPHYAGIPYWSEQHQRFWDLYEKAQVNSTEPFDSTIPATNKATSINASLYMEPLGDIAAHITFERGDEYLLFMNENTNTLKLKGINAISKGKMKSAILVIKDGSNWVLYALGGCKTFKVAGFQKRIETSLINRIKTFVNFVFEKISDDGQ